MDLFAAEIFTKGILPFLLVFVLVFAILQRSKILGEGKSKIDALVSLAIALILIGVPQPRNLIVNIMPWLAVALVVLFVIITIYGFTGELEKDKGIKLPKWFNKSLIVVAIVFVAILVLVFSGGWTYLKSISSSSIVSNVILIVVIGIVLWVAIGNKDDD